MEEQRRARRQEQNREQKAKRDRKRAEAAMPPQSPTSSETQAPTASNRAAPAAPPADRTARVGTLSRLPDGRPILSPPSVPVVLAAEQLGVTTDDVRAMVGEGLLSATPSGAGITVPSLNRALVRRKVTPSRDRRTIAPSRDKRGAAPSRTENVEERSVTIEEAAVRLKTTYRAVRTMIRRHTLETHPDGSIHGESLKKAVDAANKQRRAERPQRKATAQWRKAQRKKMAKQKEQPAKGYRQPLGGMAGGRPSSGGLPTLGRRK